MPPDIIGTGFLNRHIIEHLRSDGSRQFICRTLQNPVAYHDGAMLRPVSIADVSDAFTDAAGGIYLRAKNIVSVGIKKADDAYKFLGLRPDEKQDGSEQLEFSLEGIEVNGKSRSVNLSRKRAISPIAHNLGPLTVQSRRQGMRICLPLTNADDGFKFSLRLHLTGLSIIYMPNIDEYWIYNNRGQFRFRIRKPLLLDPATGDPLSYEGERGEYGDLVRHSLKNIGGGEYLYVKEPTEAFAKMNLPASFLVDADTCYSTTADGYVYRTDAGFSNCRNATTGTGSNSSYSSFSSATKSGYAGGSNYSIYRSFFFFDCSGITGTVVAASQYLFGYTVGDNEVMAMKGVQAASLTTADYDAFSGGSYGSKTPWSTSGYNEITFNSTGIADVQAGLGGVVKICNREDPHDYDNVSPGTSAYSNGCYYADSSGTGYDPYLSMTISSSKTSADSGAGADSGNLSAAGTITDFGIGIDLGALSAAVLSSDPGVAADSGCLTADGVDFDAGTGAEAIVVGLTLSDSGAGADAGGLLSGNISSDTGIGADSGVLSAAGLVLDAGAGAESGVLSAVNLSSDNGTGAEAIVVGLTLSDSGAGADAGGLLSGNISSDTGIGAESGVLSAVNLSSDNGIGADTGIVGMVLSDSGNGIDSSALTIVFVSSDSGIGVDVASLLTFLASSDAGVDAEEASIVGMSAFDAGAGADARPAISGAHAMLPRL